MSNDYSVKSVEDLLLGEGALVGRRALKVVFSGCNLWSGRPLQRDEGEGPCARWCDVDFYKGKVVSGESLLDALERKWSSEDVRGEGKRLVLLTGGEPALQVDEALVNALRENGFEVALETNGSIENLALAAVDWLIVSPKRGVPLVINEAHELRVVLPGTWPGPGWRDHELDALAAKGAWCSMYVQPMDIPLTQDAVGLTVLRLSGNPEAAAEAGVDEEEATAGLLAFDQVLKRCKAFVRARPKWRLSFQLGKTVELD